MADELDTINGKIKALEEVAGPLLNLLPPTGATISFGKEPGMALLYSVSIQRLILEVQRQGELTRAALKKQ